MIKNLVCILLSVLMSTSVFADCDFKKDITEDTSGNFTYSRECHIEVGKAVKSVPLLRSKVSSLEKKIELKDMMLEKQEERVREWVNTSMHAHATVMSYESARSRDNIMYFGLGIGVAVLSVWAAQKVTR